MKKNGVLTFIFAFLPGCGQMYQGYMKRGVSLLGWFCSIILLSIFLRAGWLSILLPVIWAYSFFDTFNLRALTDEQRMLFYDNYIPNTEWLKDHKLDHVIGRLGAGKIIGWGLIIVGALSLWDMFFATLYTIMAEYFPLLIPLVDGLPTILIAAVIILIGIRMLRRDRKPPSDDEIIPFQGGK